VSNPYARLCATCGRERPLGRYKGSSRTCKDCMAELSRRRRSAPAAKRADRDRRYRARYGITLEEYERLARAQRWKCAICGRPPYPKGSRLVPDHNHATGEIRGLLCQPCNSALGLMGEKPGRLEAAARYLRERGSYSDLHL